jgi:predicted 3-demethylubiquinone-9 3-methyltransferase (glyoxalase superfamily)
VFNAANDPNLFWPQGKRLLSDPAVPLKILVQEIDKFWNYFTKEGKESQCGWCIDKYGLRWQVIPNNLREFMARPNAWEVMMKQKKIVIAEY